jgi:chromosomal replication initiator protein
LQSAKEIWKRVLGQLQIEVSEANFATWLSDSRGLSCENDIFVVAVPTVFVAEWLSKRLYPLVRKTLIATMGKEVDVQFKVHEREQPLTGPPVFQTDGGISTKAAQHRFNPRYTFDTLVVGDFNRLAYAAAVEVAENPGASYNPLFIHSGTGQGKTHLLHAIGHFAVRNGLRAVYATAEQFANEFVAALRENQIDKFRSKFRNAHVLLFDDLHFLIDKKQTLQCFFHTFNELYSGNHQIVIAADCAPRDMQALSNKLRSRLEGGLVIDIQQPDFHSRVDILRAKTEKSMAQQLENVLQLVAEKVCGNIRQLEGAVVYLTAQARLTGSAPTLQAVDKLLTGTHCKQDIRMVLQTVADHFDVSTEDLVGKKRDRKTARARHVAIYLIRQQDACSLAEIGKELGGRNHTTVLHGYERIAGELNTNTQLAEELTRLREKISPHKNCKSRR